MSEPRDEAAFDRTLREIVEGTAVETGEEFFDQLVRNVARAMGTKCAWVTEWLPAERRLRALSFWAGDEYVEGYEYDVAGTPCEGVIENRGLVHVPERVIELFPDDADLDPLGAVSFMGVPLLDTDDSILGHLALLHSGPLEKSPRSDAIFRIFAGRAAAELRRLRRDRDLREREERLSLLVSSAKDAILEVDGQLTVVRMNSAAEECFGVRAQDLTGQPLDALLGGDGRATLARLVAEVDRRPEGRQSIWIPEGIAGRRADGECFPAEATLSRFEVRGQPYYTLILRNVDERVAADERIRALTDEAESLRAEIDSLQGFDEIVGESAELQRILSEVEQVAGSDASVLITGETGTGKELVARAIHRRSPRADEPLVTVNCAAIAAGLQESEFFGHEKGAFTGATRRREGRFKRADRGTLFLDEVGDLPQDLQAKLLRVLQDGEFEPVGATHTERVDVRVIAATNRNLEEMVEQGSFRSDLLYRLNVFPLRLPALRERGADVVLLAERFAHTLAQRRGLTFLGLTDAQRARLHRYDWPGNVRELQNVIERALITSVDGRRLNLERALPDVATAPSATPEPIAERVRTAGEMRDLERDNIVRALEQAGGRIAGPNGAAARLGLHPNTLASRMKSLGIGRR